MNLIPEKDALALIRQYERQYDPFQYTIADWSVWSILRDPIYTGLCFAHTSNWSMQKSIRRLLRRSVYLLSELPVFLFPGKARYFVKTMSTSRRELEGNRYKDVYVDDLLKQVGSYFKMETLNGSAEIQMRNRQAHIKSRMTTATIDILAGIACILPVSQEIQQIAIKFSADIQHNFGLASFTPRRVALTLHYFVWQKRLYEFLLHRIQPEFAILPSHTDYATVAAAHTLGIKVVEISHGMFSRDHFAALTATASLHRKTIIKPDRIFVSGEHWQKDHIPNGFYTDEIRPVGLTHMDAYRKHREQYQAQKKNDICEITLTTSGFSTPGVNAIMTDFLQRAQNNLNVVVNFKLHPAYETVKGKYISIYGNDPRVHIYLGSEEPSTFELLSHTDFHLSINSSCHFDALGMGVPTIILALDNYEIVEPLHKAGHAFLVRSGEELFKVIIENWKHYQVPITVSESYYKSSALKNMAQELANIPPSMRGVLP